MATQHIAPLRNETPVDPNPAVGVVLKNALDSTKELIENTFDLARLEAKEAITRAEKHVGKIVLFGALAALGIFPLLSFAVIGLGVLLQGNYWLSSLIVATVLFAVGIPLTLINLKKLKNEDIDLFRTKRSLKRSAEILKDSAADIKETLQDGKDIVLDNGISHHVKENRI